MDLALLDETLDAAGEPAFRARQVWEWAARGAAGYEEMTNLPAPLRERLAEELPALAERLGAGEAGGWSAVSGIPYGWRAQEIPGARKAAVTPRIETPKARIPPTKAAGAEIARIVRSRSGGRTGVDKKE